MKEKAIELVGKFKDCAGYRDTHGEYDEEIFNSNSKECALIHCDLMIQEIIKLRLSPIRIALKRRHYKDLKEEIQKL